MGYPLFGKHNLKVCVLSIETIVISTNDGVYDTPLSPLLLTAPGLTPRQGTPPYSEGSS